MTVARRAYPSTYDAEQNRIVAEMIGEINSSMYFGIAYNTETQTMYRIGSTQNVAKSAFCGTNYSPLLSAIKRCTLRDDGTVHKYIDWFDKTKYEDGSTAKLDGTDGQVMVEFIKAYYKAGVVGSVYYILFSHLPLDGFKLVPAFDGFEKLYVGAYESSLYNNKLWSVSKSPADGVSDVYPVTTRSGDWGHAGLTAQVTDSLSEARGEGWQNVDALTWLYVLNLLLASYSTYNIPSVVGVGRTILSGGTWGNGSYIGKCGLSDASVGFSASVHNGTTLGYATDFMQVAGIENFYGNVWQRTSSLVSDGAVYHKNKPYDYSSVTAGWNRLLDANGIGITLSTTSGYAGEPHSGFGVGLPANVTGSSASGMFDYYYYSSGLKVLLVGGSASDGAGAGAFCWGSVSAASSADASIGGRLCFMKT